LNAFRAFLPIFALVAGFATGGFAASCKKSDLVKCIDSACAANIATDPGSRCTSCGTAAAAKIAASKVDNYVGADDAPKFKALSLGSSSKILFSEKQLENMSTDPVERYAQAIAGCLEKVKNCDEETAHDEYDDLIEKSCKAVLSEQEYANAMTKAITANDKDLDTCQTEIGACLIDESRCGAGFLKCQGTTDGLLDQFVATCMIQVGGCESNSEDITKWARTTVDNIMDKADEKLASAKADADKRRQTEFDTRMKSCKDGSLKRQCMAQYCDAFDVMWGRDISGNPMHGFVSVLGTSGDACDKTEFPAIRQMAATICDYIDEACNAIEF
jgi:hypothetical protein